jgi:hypothetical protein
MSRNHDEKYGRLVAKIIRGSKLAEEDLDILAKYRKEFANSGDPNKLDLIKQGEILSQ